MPNAWFYYLLPPVASVFFAVMGIMLVRRFARGARDSRKRPYGADAGCFGVLLTAAGGALGLVFLITAPTPWQRQRIFDRAFRTPPDRIERFVIEAGRANQYRPLTTTEVVIDDPVRIRQIADVLRTATEISPNHPHSKWTAQVVMVTRDGTSFFAVDATVPGDPNGTLVTVSSKPDGGGWNLGDVRADGLAPILEDAVHTRRQH